MSAEYSSLRTQLITATVLAIPTLWFFDWHWGAWIAALCFYLFGTAVWLSEALKVYRAEKAGEPAASSDFVDNDDVLADGKVVWRGSKTIRFAYGDFQGDRSDREVTVHQVVAMGPTVGQTYFRGHCHLRDEPRTFRVDRIKGRKVIDAETGEISTFLKLFGLRK